jgi:hypothetical protein
MGLAVRVVCHHLGHRSHPLAWLNGLAGGECVLHRPDSTLCVSCHHLGCLVAVCVRPPRPPSECVCVSCVPLYGGWESSPCLTMTAEVPVETKSLARSC